MKKKFLGLIAVAVLALGLGACGGGTSSSQSTSSESQTSITKRYTVAFEVDGERYQTCMVKEGETITDEVRDPSKENYEFVGWFENDTQVDIKTYVVTKDVTFVAQFKEIVAEDLLNVDDVKVEGKEYYMVFGWWEVNDPAEPDKVTSGLTKDSVRIFYSNIINFYKAKGASEDNINAISFRNYSTATVAELGEKLNSDGDVDIVIGVGANIFTTAGALPYDVSENSKFQTVMGTAGKSRYTALLQGASELAKATYDWLDTEVGHKAYLEELSFEEIQGSLGGDVINLTVTVHGDTDVVTTFTSKDGVLELPTFTAPEGYNFVGLSTTQDGEVEVTVPGDGKVSYSDVKAVTPSGATTLDLYPVFEEIIIAPEDLVVYVQINGSHLKIGEAKLLESRFNATLQDKTVRFEYVEGNADAFKEALQSDADVLIGGNNPLNTYTAHADGPLANAGAKHFANTSRKVLIKDTVNPEHLELAKALYNFVVAEATEFEMHTTFWTKNNEWVTAEEVTKIKEDINNSIIAFLDVAEGSTLLEVYNVTITYYEATNIKVAELGAETLALRDGKGTDFIIGCGDNVTTKGLVEVVEKKIVDASQIAGNRHVAIVRENCLTREIYDNYFIEAVTEQQ